MISDRTAAEIMATETNKGIDLYSLEPAPEPYSQETETKLREEAISFNNLYDELNKNFYSEKDFYVVSMKWFNRWKVYTSYEEAIGNKPSSKFIGAGELPVLNEDIADNNLNVDILFEEPYEYLNTTIVEGLKSQVDYILVNRPLWTILEKYRNIKFNRKMVEGNEGKKVEVYFKKISAIILFNDVLKDLQQNKLKKFLTVKVQLPQYQSIQQLIPKMSQKLQQYTKLTSVAYRHITHEAQKMKIWIVDQTRENKFKQKLEKGCKCNRSFSYKLYMSGTKLDTNEPLSKQEIQSNSIIVFELKQNKQDWVFFNQKNPLFAKCDYCKTYNDLKILCSCLYGCYCSKQCKVKDKSTHKSRCDREAQSSEEQKQGIINENSKKGRMGLSNLGNTCFMNSGIQCITAIEDLTEYFFNNSFIADINTNNPLGTKGELSIAYSKLIKKMWCGYESYVSPSVLKRAIGKFQPMFVGYQQHDSGELITYLLDGLHEDLNRVKVKPYVQTKNHDGRPDHVLSKEGWDGFLQRNQSKIVQTLFGQYKSRLHCPKCHQQSITFDPFMTFPLPIPESNKKPMQIYLMKNHFECFKMNVVVQKSPQFTLQTVANQLAAKYNINNRMITCASSFYSCQVFSPTRQAFEIRSQFKHKHILFRVLDDNQMYEVDQPINIQHCLCSSQFGNQSYRRNITFQRVYLFNKSITTKQIHLRLYSYYKKFLDVQNYEQQIIKAEPEDQKWRINIVSNSKFDSCFFCEKKGCENCSLPFSDDIKLGDLYEKVKSWKTYKFELEIYWRKRADEVDKEFEKIEKVQGGNLGQEYITINDCFKLAQQPETLDTDNQWYCPNCKDFVLAVKQLTLYKAPKVLIVYFKRFKGKGMRGILTSKNSALIDFPIQNLDINEFLMDKQLPGVYSQPGAMQVQNKVYYDLFAISNHYGGLGGGHYTAFAKKNDQWDSYNDSSVSHAQKNELVTSEAYVLFYKRKE